MCRCCPVLLIVYRKDENKRKKGPETDVLKKKYSYADVTNKVLPDSENLTKGEVSLYK